MWMIIAAVMVFLMQAGFLMIEAGSVRSKNSVNVAQKNVSDMIICVLCYSLIGFGVMYGTTIGGYIGTGGVKRALEDIGGWPTLLIFNLAFCSVVATIVSGAVAERMRIGAYLASTAFIAILVYPIFGHWVWGNTILTSNLAFLANIGFVDHAGGIAIHALGGFYALAEIFADAALGTVLAGATGGLIGKTLGFFLNRRTFDPAASFNGILGGLVAVTAGVTFIGPMGAAIIGAIGGAVAIGGGHFILTKLKIDDPVSVVAVHGFAGITGGVLFPFFAVTDLPTGNMFTQFAIQGFGALICVVWAMLSGLLHLDSIYKASRKERINHNSQAPVTSELGYALTNMSDDNERLVQQAAIRSKMYSEAVESLTDGVLIYNSKIK